MDLIEDFRQQHLQAPKDEPDISEMDFGSERASEADFDNENNDHSFEDLGSEVYQLQFKKDLSSETFEEFSKDEIN